MGLRKFIFFLGILSCLSSAAQQLQRHEVVVAYVYNFAKNIKWQNESALSEFQFLIISHDEAYKKEFTKLAESKKLRGKPIKVHFSERTEVDNNFQLIFSGHEFENNLFDLFTKLENRNSLLVTDSYTDRRFVMINIAQRESDRIQFEINKANIVNHNMVIEPDMILLGGSEIDVAALYKESQQSLVNLQKQIDNLSSSYKELQEKIKHNEIEVEKQSKLSEEQELLIQSQLQELSAQENKLKLLQQDVQLSSATLKEKTQELNDKKIWLKEQETQVEKADRELRALNFSIDSLNQHVIEKEKVLNLQGYTIASQSKILYSLVIVIGLGVIAVILLLRWYRQKNRLNVLLTLKTNELETTNKELIQSQEEIASQHDLVASQNKELELSKLIIETQNQEIKERNLNLEAEVENRTKELIEYNQQLEQFAFISAHNLRAPVARILGLGNVLELGVHNNDPQILEKLIKTTKELDRVVIDLNTILEIRKNNTTTLSEINLEEEAELVKISLAKEISDTQTKLTTNFGKIKSIRTIRPYLDSILTNLVGNAIKYRHPKRNPEISIKAETLDHFICLTVKDNGLGIDLKLYGDKIFKLYSRFHDHVEGKGFGLYLVKTQVAAMGGKLEIKSQVNEGTAFYIYLKTQ